MIFNPPNNNKKSKRNRLILNEVTLTHCLKDMQAAVLMCEFKKPNLSCGV